MVLCRYGEAGSEVGLVGEGERVVDAMISDEELLKCPDCGNEDTLDNFDCIGADEDCVFCPECGWEFETEDEITADLPLPLFD